METRICRLHGKGDIRIETRHVALPGPGEVLLAMAAGGICGSDLHYFQDGGFGPIRVREPIILGHEASGTVLAVGSDVVGLAKGARVAVNPSRPCLDCEFCNEGLFTHCLNMRFNGSAMRLPHEQGFFRDRMLIEARQCIVSDGIASLSEVACSEPLAVCLHARNMSGSLKDKRVLITGAGPIGVLCAALAADAGASHVVVTDLQDPPLAVALAMGATRGINVARESDAMDSYCAGKGFFDIVFECSAAEPAIRTAISAIRPQGTLVQVGVAGDRSVPINLLVGKEVRFQGTHRFHAEFAQAVDLISSRRIDVRPMITDSYPMEDAALAFNVAGDRSRAVKVHLSFDPV